VNVEQAYAECRRVARASGSSFYAGMRLLPAERRDALFAVYALARRIDDVADGAAPEAEKREALQELRAELADPDASANPLVVAVADAASRRPIPLEAFGDLLDGAVADVDGIRHETFADLEVYCRRVAGSIGRLALGVFETDDRDAAEPLADDLGVALQLGNILRDLGDDLRLGRSYLPLEDFARFDCAIHGSTIVGDAELLVAFEAERALAWLEHGLTLVPLLDRRSATCVLAMTTTYRRVVEQIAANPSLALGSRVSLPSWQKRLLIARALVGSGA
jgi:phytoene synthase